MSSAARRNHQSKREVLLAKGIAGAALLRLAATSQTAALGATVMMFVVAITPVIAVWAMLLTAFMMFIGAASYWPTNLLAMCLGAMSVGGALNGMIVKYEMFMQRRASKRERDDQRPGANSKQKSPDSGRADPALRDDEDGSAGLVALLVGALTAAIVGALP